MDLMLLIGIATALLVILATLFFLQKKNASAEQDKPPQQQRGVPVRAQEGVPRRAQIARNQRNRLRQNAAGGAAAPVAAAAALDNALDDEAGSEGDEIPQGHVLDEKMGAKKRAKLEAKEQKRLTREHELQQREERKAKDAQEEEERKLLVEREADAERKQAEAERLAREERERKEHEEYLKMKQAFSVEEEGYEAPEDNEKNLLQDFIQYIKNNKVVLLEDLAQEFKLKTQQAIERIQVLQEDGTLTGVIDDRGKFIYISEEELRSVAKFIRQRGRVSIEELAENSNHLINLTPEVDV